MDVERWDAWLERVIFGLIGGALGFAILAFGGVRLREFLVVEILVALALLLWCVRIVLVRSHRLLWPPICWGVLAVVLWAVWRTTQADVEYIARGELMRVLTYTALFFVVLNNLHRQGLSQALLMGVIGIATVLCFYGAWQFTSSSNSVWGLARAVDYRHRASGSYGCPNHFAGLLEMLLPWTVATVIAGRIAPVGRIFLGYASLVMMVGLTLTFSRGGWLSAGVGLAFVLVVLCRHRDYRKPALACIAVLIIAAGVVAMRTPVMKQRIENSYDLDPQSRNSRPNIWRAATGMWRDHPWLGVGPAHFSERFKQYRTHWAHGEPDRAHNDYLNALADWGVAGTAVIAIPWVLLAYGVVRTLKQVRRDPGDLEAKRSRRYAFVLGGAGGLVALLVHSAVDFNLHIPANAMLAVTWIALLAGYSRYATDNWWVSSSWPWRPVLILFLGLPLLGAFGWDLSRRGRETLHLQRANRAPALSDEQLAQMKAAWAVEPRNAHTAALIGEVLRRRSFEGLPGNEALAQEALEWFRTAARINPYQPHYRFSAGMCLDWLEQHDRAEEEFQAALKLDPEGRITSYYMGWHQLQLGNLQAAREWFTKSVTQGWPPYRPAVDALVRLESSPPLIAPPTAQPSEQR